MEQNTSFTENLISQVETLASIMPIILKVEISKKLIANFEACISQGLRLHHHSYFGGEDEVHTTGSIHIGLMQNRNQYGLQISIRHLGDCVSNVVWRDKS